MKIKEFIEQFKYIEGINYSEYDAMNNNSTPEESLEKLIVEFAKGKIKEELLAELPKEKIVDVGIGEYTYSENKGFNQSCREHRDIVEKI